MRIIVNPAAAGGRLGREWPLLEQRLTDWGLTAETVLTKAPGHATELALEAVTSGVERIIVAGGDGTVCEVAEGLHRAGRGEVAILPLGTGNDAARTLGVPLDLEDSARAAANGHTRSVDLIRVGDRVVFNAIGVGLTGDINDRAASIKMMRGIAVYLLAALSSLLRYRMQMVRLVSDQESYEGSMLILAVHGGPTTGGGFRLTPAAVPDDGLLDACLVPEVNVFARIARLVAAMSGSLGRKSGTLELQAPWLELHFDRPLPAHFDGNSVTLKPPMVRFEVLPGALKVVVPSPEQV
ncbi:MAG: diacylglycerol kinase family lipid kinase [Acidobacteriota bacterium]|nr:diacylglycerol kinase family lipid kinase [Acidobacteriota bacterium]